MKKTSNKKVSALENRNLIFFIIGLRYIHSFINIDFFYLIIYILYLVLATTTNGLQKSQGVYKKPGNYFFQVIYMKTLSFHVNLLTYKILF